jgi:hypothetical protein
VEAEGVDPVIGIILPQVSDLRKTLSQNFEAGAIASCAPIPSTPVVL